MLWKHKGTVAFVILAVGGFIGFLRIDSAFERLDKLREDRYQDVSRTDFEACRRLNFQDDRDRSQDNELLGLVEAALDPSGAFRREAPKSQRRLKERVDAPPHLPNHGQFTKKPIDCTKLPSQRPFKK